MSEQLRMYTRALYGFDHVARLAPADAWDRPTPCEGWTARHVIGHVIAIQRYIESRVRGVEPPMDPMTEPQRHAGDDPYAAWAAARDAVLEAVDHPHVLDRVVASFSGQRRVDDLIGFNVGDTTVHSWDLARALGVDDRLDPALVDRALQLIVPIADGMRRPKVFGAAVEAAEDADAQTRLLALTGRDPGT